jgi:hypothetical protein
LNPDRLAWKAILLTSLFEFGDRDPFSFVSGGAAREPDIEFGIGWWSLQRRTLQPVLRKMRSVDPQRFEAIMGDGLPLMMDIIEKPVAEAVELTKASLLGGERGRQVLEPWRSRFGRLGAWPAFQRVQFEEMQPWIERARSAGQALGLRSERAFAFLYDTIIQYGTGAVRAQVVQPHFDAFAREIGRMPDEQERLLIIANVVTSRVGVPALARFVRTRRLIFALGTGTFSGKPINLAEAGFAMTDIATGARIPLVNDEEIVRRLVDGWLPAGGAR